MSTQPTFKIGPLKNVTKTIQLDENRSIQEQLKNLEVETVDYDSQVKVQKNRAARRKFSSAYKLQILNALDACKNGEERASLLRKEGLYYARICTWRKRFQSEGSVGNKTPKSVLLTQQLTREVATLKKKLSQAEAIIDVQKKVSELLSISILNHDANEMSS
jgi:transposase